MRVNVYAEEMTDRVEIVEKTIDGHVFTGIRFYLALPVTVPGSPASVNAGTTQIRGPFIHREGDDDSAAVTFWGKQDLRITLQKGIDLLDDFFAPEPVRTGGGGADMTAERAMKDLRGDDVAG